MSESFAEKMYTRGLYLCAGILKPKNRADCMLKAIVDEDKLTVSYLILEDWSQFALNTFLFVSCLARNKCICEIILGFGANVYSLNEKRENVYTFARNLQLDEMVNYFKQFQKAKRNFW